MKIIGLIEEVKYKTGYLAFEGKHRNLMGIIAKLNLYLGLMYMHSNACMFEHIIL